MQNKDVEYDLHKEPPNHNTLGLILMYIFLGLFGTAAFSLIYSFDPTWIFVPLIIGGAVIVTYILSTTDSLDENKEFNNDRTS